MTSVKYQCDRIQVNNVWIILKNGENQWAVKIGSVPPTHDGQEYTSRSLLSPCPIPYQWQILLQKICPLCIIMLGLSRGARNYAIYTKHNICVNVSKYGCIYVHVPWEQGLWSKCEVHLCTVRPCNLAHWVVSSSGGIMSWFISNLIPNTIVTHTCISRVMGCHQAITWTNVDWSSVKSSDIHIRAISQEMPQPSVTKICLKITCLR